MAGQLKVRSQKTVMFNKGYSGQSPSQVTTVELDGVIGYVREHRKASSMENFMLSSGARLGNKADGNRVGVEILELAAPARAWDAIAKEVEALDTMHRPVRRSPQWTVERAQDTLTKGRR